jgi:hypothetical protein
MRESTDIYDLFVLKKALTTDINDDDIGPW